MPPHRSITAIGSTAGCWLLDRGMALPVCRRCLVLFTVQRHAAAALLAPERIAHHRDGLQRHRGMAERIFSTGVAGDRRWWYKHRPRMCHAGVQAW